MNERERRFLLQVSYVMCTDDRLLSQGILHLKRENPLICLLGGEIRGMSCIICWTIIVPCYVQLRSKYCMQFQKGLLIKQLWCHKFIGPTENILNRKIFSRSICSLFIYTLSVTHTLYSVEWNFDKWMMNPKDLKKRWWPNLKVPFRHSSGVMSKTTKNFT